MEQELKQDIESEYKRKQKYDQSGKFQTFATGAIIGLGISLAIDFILSWGVFYVISPTGTELWLYRLCGLLIVLGCGYLGMKSMGKFNEKLIEEIKSLFR